MFWVTFFNFIDRPCRVFHVLDSDTDNAGVDSDELDVLSEVIDEFPNDGLCEGATVDDEEVLRAVEIDLLGHVKAKSERFELGGDIEGFIGGAVVSVVFL